MGMVRIRLSGHRENRELDKVPDVQVIRKAFIAAPKPPESMALWCGI